MDDSLEKIAHAALEAEKLIAQHAAVAKKVIDEAANSALSTLTTATALQGRDISYIREGLTEITKKLDALDGRYVSMPVHVILERKVDELDADAVRKDEFIFWRNLLVSGVLMTLAVGVVESLLKR